MQEFTQFVINHWTLWLAFVIIVALIIECEFHQYSNASVSISPQKLVDLVNNNQSIVVDIRSPEEYASGHILHARHCAKDEVAQSFKAHRDKMIILVCQSGQESHRLVPTLQGLEFKQIFALQGGIANWDKQQLPLHSKPSKTKRNPNHE